MKRLGSTLWFLLLCGCPASGGAAPAPDAGPTADVAPRSEPLALRVVTFNTGTGGGWSSEAANLGYGEQQAAWCDELYGNGLSWEPFIEQTRAFFDQLQPDVVAFQEIFWPGECAEIPPEAWPGFVCEGWAEGDPVVAQRVLGEDFQVACHPGKPDKCAAVRTSVGAFRGCDGALCLDGLDGFQVEDCGKGARVARGVIDLVGGGELTVVSFHGTSGFTEDESACRVRQVDQVFVDLGDGEPGASGASGAPNLVLGDFNTDPGRLAEGDPSAARWLDFVGEGRDFHWVSDVGEDAAPTYAVLFNIDHVVSDALVGTCWAPGVTEGAPPVTEAVFFDHLPIVCDVAE